MGTFNKVDEAMGYRSENLGPEKFAEIVQQNFITDASKKQLKTLRKMVKSGFWRSGPASFAKTSMKTNDKRYVLKLSQAIWLHDLILGTRIVWLRDNTDKIIYRLKQRDFRALRKATLPLIDAERKKANITIDGEEKWD